MVSRRSIGRDNSKVRGDGTEKKWADPFSHFLKAGRIDGGFWRTDNVRPAGKIKRWSKAAGDGIPREERVETTGHTGSGQDWMEEG